MNLSLSKKADYVVKAAIALARRYDGESYLKIREIAAEMAIPRTYTPQILDALIQTGLVESRAGKSGGYRLTRDPDQITVLEVLESGEGSLKSQRCALSEGPCRWDNVCPMHEVVSEAVKRFRDTMNAELLSRISSRDLLLEHGELPTPSDPHIRSDPQRDFQVKSEINISCARDDLVTKVQHQDGDWLGVLMTQSLEDAIAGKNVGYLFPKTLSPRDSFAVNLGYVRTEEASIVVPVTFESARARFEVPEFVGAFTFETRSDGSTRCTLAGRIEFPPVLFSGLQLADRAAQDNLHTELEGLSQSIFATFLAMFAHQCAADSEFVKG